MATHLLAVHQDTNANAALFEDGKLIFAAAEERFTRVRFAGGRPARTIRALAERYSLGSGDFDEVVAGNRYHFLPETPLAALLPRGEYDFFSPTYKAYLELHEALWRAPELGSLAAGVHRALLRRRYPALAHVADHHTAHAYSAYLTSGFDEAVAITADGFGDGASAKVFRCRGARCELLYGSSATRSPGLFYGEIARLLGINVALAGKVTGLAAHGDARKAYGLVSQLFALAPDGRSFEAPPLRARRRNRSPYAELATMDKADVAAAAQRRLEDVLLGFVARALEEVGPSDVVLAGGTFGNVRLNQKILDVPGVRRVFVHPAMNDQGIAVGAALEHLALTGRARPARLDHVYLGPDFSEDECARALTSAGLRFREERDIERTAAELLTAGHVVARFAGRMEYGPRALGNRSLLYRSDEPGANDWLNRKLRRTEYMPFAPVTLAEHAEARYGSLERCADCTRFMTIALPCTDTMRRESPGAVHVDGTARPQVVHEEDNPSYYRLLRLFHERTGNPSLINTSFNMHEEPIVCTPDDACRAFLAAGLPYLAMERFLVVAPGVRFPD
ncbi:carbamoyltransferase C-terminal domain-containing protein [Sandaracinus amylolyticus]|uniref:carbamoyltransferase C-terminal domain-containing protein n=1 Tax=Sandaracinus amylolyticus TaxID=927083 RepID=UPI001F32844A|nr:carbamoyltransferase C-terminal domain-containing protein [Sandaracinus amylolyticus]UJR84383.1 Hypothetical protein I5071_64620 [Sandaracinus amylolyticus]